MLVSLHIENIAVIKKASVDFDKGMIVFTGETGAGKSILIDAINAVLGFRTSRELVRNGADAAHVTAIFGDLSDKIISVIEQNGYKTEDDRSIMISREITADGKTTCRIGGRPATATLLREISGLLINIHGQHDNQQILNPELHLNFIDKFGGFTDVLENYKRSYSLYIEADSQLKKIAAGKKEKERLADILSFQVAEIEKADLKLGEEEELLAERKVIKNSAKILELLESSRIILQGDDEFEGINSFFSALTGNLQALGGFIEGYAEKAAEVEEMSFELSELSHDIASAVSAMDFDPKRLDDIEQRLDIIFRMKKKYGPEVADVLEFYQKSSEQLEAINISDEELALLETKRKILKEKALEQAEALSNERRKTSLEFIEKIKEELVFLDMPSVNFVNNVERCELCENGIDSLEFYISTNTGEPPKPLVKIASGGELARIMLAIKNVFAETDDIPTLIFDEVDSGVSGKAADKIGRKLWQVGRNRQVICVTHLSQVASYADSHFEIIKSSDESQTFTQVTLLRDEKRVRELARISSGENITQTNLQNAAEMLKSAEIFKASL